MSSNPVDKTSLAAQAIRLFNANNCATLATHSAKHEGFPFASLVQYAAAEWGDPILLISAMATHTRNLKLNSHASLMIQENAGLSSGRLTLIGKVIAIEDSSLKSSRTAYLQANPDAAQWVDFGDFQFFRLDLVEAYMVAGFGTMGWISATEWNSEANPGA